MNNLIKNKNEIKRVKTYIVGLDENLQGGIPEGSIVLVSGTSGTMKSTVSFNILYNEAKKGKNCLYISLEQSSISLLNHVTNMEYNLSDVNLVVIEDISRLDEAINEMGSKKGCLAILDLGAIRKKIKATTFGPSADWLNAIKNTIKKINIGSNCHIFVLDSLSALYVLSKFTDVRTELFYVFEFLRDSGLTSFLISEMPLNKERYSEYEVEGFLADGIIKLELNERYRKVTREISIVKMRTTAHNTDVFTLEYKDKKLHALYGGQTPLV